MFDDLQATIDAATHYQDPLSALEAAIAVALAVRRHVNDLKAIERQAKELAREIPPPARARRARPGSPVWGFQRGRA